MLSINRQLCGYCGACVSVCSGGCLELMDVIITINEKDCVLCGLCVKACPVGAIIIDKETESL